MTPEKLLEKAENVIQRQQEYEENQFYDGHRSLLAEYLDARETLQLAANPAYVAKLCRVAIMAKKAIECRKGLRNAGEYSKILDELEKALAALEEVRDEISINGIMVGMMAMWGCLIIDVSDLISGFIGGIP